MREESSAVLGMRDQVPRSVSPLQRAGYLPAESDGGVQQGREMRNRNGLFGSMGQAFQAPRLTLLLLGSLSVRL